MPVYAIGDLQGCFDQLEKLLNEMAFDADRDRLWFVGDLVNRGPKSLQTLRFIKSLGERAVSVLGNHDLSLLAIAAGHVRKRRRDTVDDILQADDRDELLDWLRNRPLLHHDTDLGYTMIHAGLPPQWDLPTARACAEEVETALRGDDYGNFLAHMYGDEPRRWSDDLRGWERLRFITNCFTRLRYCDTEGRLHLHSAGAPGSQPAPFVPWFDVPGRASAASRIVFGHWSSLGAYTAPGIFCVDSGCLWGGQLSALRLDGTPTWTSIPCPQHLSIDN